MVDVAREGAEALSASKKDLLESLHTMGDREAAIIGSGYLDDALRAMLEAFLVDGYENVAKGALPGSFAARCSLAFALGLVGPNMLKDLRLLGDIRNSFAHRWQTIGFSTPEIASSCGGLFHGDLAADGQEIGSRQRYLKVIWLFSNHMLSRASGLRHSTMGSDFRWTIADSHASVVMAEHSGEEE